MTIPNSEDTIIALASGRGAAGVAVLRLSGEKAIEIADNIFTPTKGKIAAGRLVYGSLKSANGEILDDCMVVIMPAPHSFTGEDVAEIQCHGSSAVISAIIDRCIEIGARPAQPGEYSRRAFMNGKMDLAQAEALTDLISSRSEAARRLSLRQLRGGLSQKLHGMNSVLLDAAAEIEAHIDFPEEDIPDMARDRILSRINDARQKMQKLLDGHEKARIRNEGARVILAGEPNAGKSSLFNALVGRERAIVSPHPGTTRDTIESVIEIKGLEVTLIDTAGIRQGAGEIEQIGIDRTYQEMLQADIVLHLAEGANGIKPTWNNLSGIEDSRVIKIWTKCDAAGFVKQTPDDGILQVSSVEERGLDSLERVLSDRLIGTDIDDPDADMSRVRHADNLRKAMASVNFAYSAFESGESGDLVMVDLRDGLSYIGEITGERLDEQILDRVFSTFCLGK